MGSQETIPDETLYQEYQNRLVVRDNAIHPASELAEPAPASKQSGENEKDEQPGECATRGAISHIDARHQAEKNGTEVAGLLDELNNLMEQHKHISSKVDDVVSRLQEALKQSTHRSLSKSGKLVRWADSARAHGSDDDTHRPRKRARGGL